MMRFKTFSSVLPAIAPVLPAIMALLCASPAYGNDTRDYTDLIGHQHPGPQFIVTVVLGPVKTDKDLFVVTDFGLGLGLGNKRSLLQGSVFVSMRSQPQLIPMNAVIGWGFNIGFRTWLLAKEPRLVTFTEFDLHQWSKTRLALRELVMVGSRFAIGGGPEVQLVRLVKNRQLNRLEVDEYAVGGAVQFEARELINSDFSTRVYIRATMMGATRYDEVRGLVNFPQGEIVVGFDLLF